MKSPPLPLDLRIALIYALFSGLWILFSDSLLASFIQDSGALTHAQTYKGWAFVAFSAGLIFLLLRRELKLRVAAHLKSDESEERYRQLFENSLDAILLTTPDGSIYAANAAACAMFGRSEEEIVRIGRDGLTDTGDPRLAAALEERARVGKFHGELTFLRANGERFEGEVSTTLFRDSKNAERTSMIIRDVSGRKRAEKELRLLEERFSKAFHASPAGLTLTRIADGQFIDVNEAFCRMFEFTRDEVVGRSSVELNMWSPEERRRLIQAQLASDGLKNFELRARAKSGREIDVLFSSKIIDVGGEPCLITTMIDVTEKKRAEQALLRFNQIQSGLVRLGNALAAAPDLIASCRAAYRHLQDMIDCPNFGVSLFDPKTSLLRAAYINADGQEIDVSQIPPLRYDPAQATGGRALAIASQKAVIVEDLSAKTRAAGGIVVGDAREPDSAIYVPMIVEGKVIGLMELQSYQRRAYAPEDGEWLAVAANQIGLGLQNARLLEETRLSRDRLAELSRRLAQAREAESRAIGRELHDQIGQALTALKLTLEILPQLPPENAPKKLEMAQNLTDELLTHVRRMSLELRPPMLDDLGLIPTLLWHVNRYQEQTNIAVEFKHSGAENRRFPPEAETAAYRIIQEALTNIARHAQTSRVALQVRASEETLEIAIQDFGRGFDVQAALQKQTSSGLRGMEERARLLDGTFEVQSQPNQGALLKITLPVKESA